MKKAFIGGAILFLLSQIFHAATDYFVLKKALQSLEPISVQVVKP